MCHGSRRVTNAKRNSLKAKARRTWTWLSLVAGKQLLQAVSSLSFSLSLKWTLLPMQGMFSVQYPALKSAVCGRKSFLWILIVVLSGPFNWANPWLTGEKDEGEVPANAWGLRGIPVLHKYTQFPVLSLQDGMYWGNEEWRINRKRIVDSFSVCFHLRKSKEFFFSFCFFF